jgi:predicted DNA-binding transcriptional regulator AlpA
MSSHTASPPPAGLSEGLAAYRLLTSDEAALLLGVPVATLRTWRSRRRGYGPRAVRVGGSIRYRLADLLAWIDEHTETPDGNVPEGIEASQRGKAPPAADLPPLTRQRRPNRTTRSGGSRDHGSATAR